MPSSSRSIATLLADETTGPTLVVCPRRCEPLAVTVRDRDVITLLGPAYDALAARDD